MRFVDDENVVAVARRAEVFLADQLGERLRPVVTGDDLVHAAGNLRKYARPRVIRGTRVKPLPLLPSGPGGVCSRPLHEARSLTTSYATSFVLVGQPFDRPGSPCWQTSPKL